MGPKTRSRESSDVKAMKLMKTKSMLTRLPNIGDGDPCGECVFGKQARFPLGHDTRKSQHSNECLQRIHMDICSPVNVESFRGNRFFLLLVDYFTRLTWIYFLRSKGEAFKNFIKFQALVELEMGIKQELMTSYTPQLNGIMERKTRRSWKRLTTC